jgi:hypothetical protein
LTEKEREKEEGERKRKRHVKALYVVSREDEIWAKSRTIPRNDLKMCSPRDEQDETTPCRGEKL